MRLFNTPLPVSAHNGIILAIIIVFAVAGFGFSVSEHLPGFGDDSAIYLIMASNLSPYTHPTHSFTQSFHYFHLPPAFPLLASILGIEDSVKHMHTFVLTQLVLALIIYIILCNILLNREYAIIPVLFFALLPATWIEMLKIMSENQFILLSLLTILIAERFKRGIFSIRMCVTLGLLISLVTLTRTIGVVLFIAFIIRFYLPFSFFNKNLKVITCFVSSFIIPIALWKLYSPDTSYSYINDFINLAHGDSPAKNIWAILSNNLIAIDKAWITSFVIQANTETSLRALLAYTVIAPIVIGIISRSRSIDVIYMGLYLCILLMWPYPDEMNRFLYPIMPLFILYMIIGIIIISSHFNYRPVTWILSATLICFLPAPSMAHILDRYAAGRNAYGADITHIPELYEHPSKTLALSTAYLWYEQMDIMKSLKDAPDSINKILTIKPHMLTYLSGIYAERIPIYVNSARKEYYQYIYGSDATHLVITTIPISRDTSNQDAKSALKPITKNIFSIKLPTQSGNKEIFSLLEIKK